MPNSERKQTVYVATGNPDTVNDATTILQYAGQLGQGYDTNDRKYQYVQMDSGVTAATPAGAVAAGDIAYWMDRSVYKVTNGSRFALLGATASSFRNNVAGVFRNASATHGNGIFILQRGRAISVNEAGSATPGMILISDTSTTASQTLGVAINTAPQAIQLGVVRTATSAGQCVADLDIPDIP